MDLTFGFLKSFKLTVGKRNWGYVLEKPNTITCKHLYGNLFRNGISVDTFLSLATFGVVLRSCFLFSFLEKIKNDTKSFGTPSFWKQPPEACRLREPWETVFEFFSVFFIPVSLKFGRPRYLESGKWKKKWEWKLKRKTRFRKRY